MWYLIGFISERQTGLAQLKKYEVRVKNQGLFFLHDLLILPHFEVISFYWNKINKNNIFISLEATVLRWSPHNFYVAILDFGASQKYIPLIAIGVKKPLKLFIHDPRLFWKFIKATTPPPP